jgi:GT2 family glycosyltransferase
MSLRAIIPSFNDDLLLKLLYSMEASEPDSTRCVIVGDNGITQTVKDKFPLVKYVQVPHIPFIHMQALNCMVDAADSKDDIVVFGDDTTILTPVWYTTSQLILANWSTKYVTFGMLNFQQNYYLNYGDYGKWLALRKNTADLFSSSWTLPICGSLFPRRILDLVGRFDERFVGYAYDDVDYCVRILHAGFTLGITDVVQINHVGQVSYTRAQQLFLDPSATENRKLFYAKYGLPLGKPGFPDAAPHLCYCKCGCIPLNKTSYDSNENL